MEVLFYRYLDDLYAVAAKKNTRSYTIIGSIYEFDYLRRISFNRCTSLCISESKEEAIKLTLDKAKRELNFHELKVHSLKHKILKITSKYHI